MIVTASRALMLLNLACRLARRLGAFAIFCAGDGRRLGIPRRGSQFARRAPDGAGVREQKAALGDTQPPTVAADVVAAASRATY